jgi:hypothetical protein
MSITHDSDERTLSFLLLALFVSWSGFALFERMEDRVAARVQPTSSTLSLQSTGVHDGFSSAGSALIDAITPDVVSGATGGGNGWDTPPVSVPTTRYKQVTIVDEQPAPVARIAPKPVAASLTTACQKKHVAKRDSVCATSTNPVKCEQSFAKYTHSASIVPYQNGSKQACVTAKDAGRCASVCGKKGFKLAGDNEDGRACTPGRNLASLGYFICRAK